MIHAIAHWLGWNTGTVVSDRDGKGRLWTGFQCSGCNVTTWHQAGKSAEAKS